jgi:hypothetical protein
LILSKQNARTPPFLAAYREGGRQQRLAIVIMTNPPRRGRPRLEYRAKTIEAKKPWEAKAMSRSTWYRRKREKAALQGVDAEKQVN